MRTAKRPGWTWRVLVALMLCYAVSEAAAAPCSEIDGRYVNRGTENTNGLAYLHSLVPISDPQYSNLKRPVPGDGFTLLAVTAEIEFQQGRIWLKFFDGQGELLASTYGRGSWECQSGRVTRRHEEEAGGEGYEGRRRIDDELLRDASGGLQWIQTYSQVGGKVYGGPQVTTFVRQFSGSVVPGAGALTANAREADCNVGGLYLNNGTPMLEENAHGTAPVAYLDSMIGSAPAAALLFKFDPTTRNSTHLATMVRMEYSGGEVKMDFLDASGQSIVQTASRFRWQCTSEGLKAEYEVNRGAEGSPGTARVVHTLSREGNGTLNWATSTTQLTGRNWGGAQARRDARVFPVTERVQR
jgi:hypothetical protein